MHNTIAAPTNATGSRGSIPNSRTATNFDAHISALREATAYTVIPYKPGPARRSANAPNNPDSIAIS